MYADGVNLLQKI